jgi:predicted nuclease of predicted toxin-antitoxin system
VRFLIDTQLPPALARVLEEHGHVAEHVNDIGLGDAPDSDLWRYALEHDAVIVTRDEDFADRLAVRNDGPSVVWIRVASAPTRDAPAATSRQTFGSTARRCAGAVSQTARTSTQMTIRNETWSSSASMSRHEATSDLCPVWSGSTP